MGPLYCSFPHVSIFLLLADALLILSDAVSLSVAPSNRSSSRIRLPKLPAHISPWEQQQWVPKMQLLIAPRHRYYSPPCCWPSVSHRNTQQLVSLQYFIKLSSDRMTECGSVVEFLYNWSEWCWGTSGWNDFLVKIRSHCLLCNLLSSFGVCFQSGAFRGVGNDFHSMWPEMQGSCEQLASK